MKSALQNFLSEMRASYWYIPLMMLFLTVLLATLTLQLDEIRPVEWLGQISWLVGHNPDGARSFLSTIATAMITIVSVTFSMTLLAVSFAGSQIGPRLTSNFMRDKSNQVALGTFIATFLYCLLIMRAIVKNNATDMVALNTPFVPQISLFIALLMAIGSLMMLIYFIHHIPESMNMSNVVAQVGETLFKQVDKRFPVNVGEGAEDSKFNISHDYHTHVTSIPAHQHGYIRILDANSLIELAEQQNCILQLEANIGNFITENCPLLTVYSKKPVTDKFVKQCQKAYAVGHQRNQEQDLEFLINELIEIIARALSPGVNDPYTAMNAMDWLCLFLQKTANTKTPSRARLDSEKHVRLLTPFMDFYYYAEHIFSRTYQYICKDYNMSVYTLTLLQKLSEQTDTEYKTFLNEQAQYLIDDARNSIGDLSLQKSLQSFSGL